MTKNSSMPGRGIKIFIFSLTALFGLAAASFAQMPLPETMVPREVLGELQQRIAQEGGAPISSLPAESAHYRVRLNAFLYSESTILVQPAILTVEFDMARAANINNEREIGRFRFTLEVQGGGVIPMPAYTMRTLGPDSPTDFCSPDPTWWSSGLFLSKESFREDRIDFYIEAPASVDASAAGTVLDSAIKAKALLKLYPYCTRDLKTCRLGNLTGITYEKRGLGWLDRLYPDFQLVSKETFSLAEVAPPAR